MTHRATQEVVQRVRPLLERLATRTIDRARLLQYLSAMAGVDWGVLRVRERALVADEEGEVETLTLQDVVSHQHHRIQYPRCLPRDLDIAVREEYKRLALDRPLTTMNQALFDHFYAASHCARCRWAGPRFAQFHLECRFAGHPVNYEPADS